MDASAIITTIGCVVGVVGGVIGVVGYFSGQKKSSNSEVERRAFFEGEITANIKTILTTLEKLEEKLSHSTDSIYDEINKRFSEHIERYHKNV